MAISRKSVPENVSLRVGMLANYALQVSFARSGEFDSTNAVKLRMYVEGLERQMPWIKEYYDEDIITERREFEERQKYYD